MTGAMEILDQPLEISKGENLSSNDYHKNQGFAIIGTLAVNPA